MEYGDTWTSGTPETGTVSLTVFPTCPECGAPWKNDHRDGGHCPGRPEGCVCRCDMQYHRPPYGIHRPSFREPFCPCRYVPEVRRA